MKIGDRVERIMDQSPGVEWTQDVLDELLSDDREGCDNCAEFFHYSSIHEIDHVDGRGKRDGSVVYLCLACIKAIAVVRNHWSTDTFWNDLEEGSGTRSTEEVQEM